MNRKGINGLKKGVTLIELMVVISIIGILSSIAFINITRFIDVTELRTTSFALNAIVNTTRVLTFSTEKIHWLKYEDNCFNVYQDDGDNVYTMKDKKLLNLCYKISNKLNIGFTNKNAEKFGIKFGYEKKWWPAGSILLTVDGIDKNFKLTFPVNSDRCNFYEINYGVLTRR